jgi:hypothetical protein
LSGSKSGNVKDMRDDESMVLPSWTFCLLSLHIPPSISVSFHGSLLSSPFPSSNPPC